MTGEKEIKLPIEKDPRDVALSDLTPYLGEREYNCDAFVEEARQYCQMALTGFLKAGGLLICLKKMEGHGGFMEALKKIGIPYQRANEMMAMAYYVTNHLVRQLPDSGNLKRLETMGKTRLLLLSRIPDDVMEMFDNEGDILGMTIDEVSAMPLDELRRQVREMKEKMKNGKLQNRKLQEKCDNLTQKMKKNQGLDETLEGVRAWSREIVDHLTQILALVNPENAPKKAAFEGKNGGACHAHLKTIDALVERVGFDYEHTLKDALGLE